MSLFRAVFCPAAVALAAAAATSHLQHRFDSVKESALAELTGAEETN